MGVEVAVGVLASVQIAAELGVEVGGGVGVGVRGEFPYLHVVGEDGLEIETRLLIAAVPAAPSRICGTVEIQVKGVLKAPAKVRGR